MEALWRTRVAMPLPSPQYGRLDWQHGTLRYRCTGEGPAIVLAPDPPNVLEHLDALVATLADAGWRVVAFELPGFGFSRARRSFDFGAPQVVEATWAVMDQVGVNRAVLMLPCVAGHAALAAAASVPGRVAGVVLSQTPGLEAAHEWTRRVDPRGLLARKPLGQAIMAVASRRVANAWYGAAVNEPGRRQWFRQAAGRALEAGAQFRLASGFQAFLAQGASVEVPGTIPVLALWGDADRTHRRTDPASICSKVPHARIHRIASAGHFPELDEPELVAQIIGQLAF